MTTVAVLGGGVAGLSAAHELAERGFDVTVYEHARRAGRQGAQHPVRRLRHGRARRPAGRARLPLLPGLLPSPSGHDGPDPARPAARSRDHLVGATRILFAQVGGPNEIIAPAHLPESAEDFAVLARFLREAASQVGVPPHEYALLVERLLTLLTSCDERREQQWDLQSWWDYTGAERRSAAFQRFLADGLTRTLVAARGREMSARTGGAGAHPAAAGPHARGRPRRPRARRADERGVDRPVGRRTCESRGVELRLGEPVEALHVVGRRGSTGATVGGRTVRADHYVAALPVEVMRQLASPALRAAEPRLKGLDRLVTRWMNGVLFYLDRDVPLVNGHAIYIDSEWSLTSISQKQFWPGVDLSRRGDGRTRGILSIDVSEWQRPGRLHGQGRPALQPARRSSTRSGTSSRTTSTARSTGVTVIDRFLDPAIVFPNPTGAANLEPLLVNTAGSWADRPDAVTRIPNLFLASDYVRTHTDLATMEAANEAARRAVNGILAATGSSARPLRGLEAARAAGVRRGARARPGALEAVPPAGQAAAGAHGRRATCARAACVGRALLRAPTLLRRPTRRRLQPRRGAALLERVEAERLDRPDGADRVRAVAAGGALRGPGQERGGEVVGVGAAEVDLGERLAGRVVGDGGDPGQRVGRRAGLGRARERDEPLAGGLQHAAHARQLERDGPGQRAGLQRLGERRRTSRGRR